MTMQFYWNKAPMINAVRQISQETLESMKPAAQTAWESVVPVGKERIYKTSDRDPHKSGTLRDSWKSFVFAGRTAVTLFFGATARYAVYVELGTGKMAPRAPIRKTAEILAPTLKERLATRAAQYGLRVT